MLHKNESGAASTVEPPALSITNQGDTDWVLAAMPLLSKVSHFARRRHSRLPEATHLPSRNHRQCGERSDHESDEETCPRHVVWVPSPSHHTWTAAAATEGGFVLLAMMPPPGHQARRQRSDEASHRQVLHWSPLDDRRQMPFDDRTVQECSRRTRPSNALAARRRGGTRHPTTSSSPPPPRGFRSVLPSSGPPPFRGTTAPARHPSDYAA